MDPNLVLCIDEDRNVGARAGEGDLPETGKVIRRRRKGVGARYWRFSNG